jgi:hypothetical protein
MRKESMGFKRMWVHKHFFQSKMVMDISKEVDDMKKAKEVEEEADLEEEVVAAPIAQLVNRIKQIGH